MIGESHRLIGSPGRVLLALSGGADSVALFHLLKALGPEAGFALHAAHVHHGLRAAADEEAGFVSDLCAAAGVPLVLSRVSVARTGSLEAAARAVRYEALEEARARCHCQVIALAHHADDQAETLLLHLLYGAGPGGLAGMREFSRGLWRPLLGVERGRLRRFLQANRFHWREDESNADPRFRRNAVRGRLMPVLRALSPTVVGQLGRTAGTLAVEEDYWEGFAADWLRLNASFDPPAPFLMAAPCEALHPAARRRVLRRFCESVGVVLDHAQTLRLDALLGVGPQRIDNLPGGGRALRTKERLFLLLPGSQAQPALGRLSEGPPAEAGAPSERFDAAQLEGAVLRRRQPGDRISPLGAGGSKPLNEYMTDRKIDRPLRDAWPLLCRGSEVLWVVGVGMAQTAAVTENTRQTRRLWYEGRLPGQI